MSRVGSGASQFTNASDTNQGTLTPSASRTVNVAFNPSTAGAKSASLKILSNDSNEGTVDVSLTGTGFDPDVGLASLVYIDFAHGGVESGTSPSQPFNTLADISHMGARDHHGHVIEHCRDTY